MKNNITKRGQVLLLTCPLFFLMMVVISSGCGPKHRVQWEKYTPEIMADARKSGKPIFADFYAAWCGPCMRMKESTFADERVIQALEPFRRIKADLSFIHSKESNAISKEFKIGGLPTMLFFDPKGEVVEEFRLSGYISPDEFLQIVQKFRSRFDV